MPRLVDGREVDSASEDWRHECEARWILNLPSLQQRREWLASLEPKRGKTEVQRLKTTMEALWRAR